MKFKQCCYVQGPTKQIVNNPQLLIFDSSQEKKMKTAMHNNKVYITYTRQPLPFDISVIPLDTN